MTADIPHERRLVICRHVRRVRWRMDPAAGAEVRRVALCQDCGCTNLVSGPAETTQLFDHQAGQDQRQAWAIQTAARREAARLLTGTHRHDRSRTR